MEKLFRQNLISFVTVIFVIAFHCCLFAQSDSYVWFEDFATNKIDTTKWTIISGSPKISSAVSSHALKLVSQEAIETKYIQLMGYDRLLISFKYQNRNTDRNNN